MQSNLRKKRNIPYVVGRALFGSFFIWNGINHFKQRQALKQFAKAKHIPAPDAAVAGSGMALIVGGTTLALGIMPQIGAASLIAFLAASSTMAHAFWKDKDPNERMQNMTHFSKNMALLSATLALAAAEKE
jgi:putative oxidoreductase